MSDGAAGSGRVALVPAAGPHRPFGPFGPVGTEGQRGEAAGRSSGPLIGRTSERQQLQAVISPEATAGLVISGPPGVGRTRLLQEAALLAQEQGWEISWFRATYPSVATSVEQLLRVLVNGRPRGSDRPRLFVVDDAHLLDPATAALVYELAATGSATVVVSICTAIHPAWPVTSLWKDGLCDRLDLSPLARADAQALAQHLLGGPVAMNLGDRLWRVASGNPLHLTELALGWAQEGAIIRPGKSWAWNGPSDLPRRLTDLICARLADLSPAQRDALELVAEAGPCGLDVLIKAGTSSDVLSDLERSGRIVARTSGLRLLLEMADPLVGQVVQQQSGELRTRAIHAQLAVVLQAIGARRGDDALRLASSQLATGSPVLPATGTAAASRALQLLNVLMAEKLARQALASGGGLQAAIVLAQTLIAQARYDEAKAVVVPWEEPAEQSDALAVSLIRASASQWGSDHGTAEGQAELARWQQASVPGPLRAEAFLLTSKFRLFEGRFAAALDASRQAIAASESGQDVWQRAMVAKITGLAAIGQPVRAAELGQRALTARETDLHEDQAGPFVREELATAVCRAYLMQGDLAAARDLAVRGRRRARAGRHEILSMWWNTQLAQVALGYGRVRNALSLLRQAEELETHAPRSEHYLPLVRFMMMRTKIRALVLVGDLDTAEQVADESARLGRGVFAISELWQPDPVFWLAAAKGQESRAVELAVQDADRAAAAGARSFELEALHQVIRLGRADQVVDRMREVQRMVISPMHEAYVQHAEALAGEDPVEMEAVARRFHGFGTRLLAVEAAAGAGWLLRMSGRTSSARRVSVLASNWRSECDDVLTPMTSLMVDSPELTQRQREIARLAAQGLASRAIAARLVLSVRTVDNYLGQIYRKLGVASRSELADLLDVPSSSRTG
jgi:DNA-binding CsgD family transcriptional regulator